MNSKLFQRRDKDAPAPSEFAPTMVGAPEPGEPEPASWPRFTGDPLEASLTDSSAPDSAHGDSSAAGAAVPDVVTDIGGMGTDVPDPSETPTLSHIGRYALKRQLGAGGLGAVFEAWDPLLSRVVAIKTLQIDVDTQSRVSLDGLFLNEARAAAGLNHKNIVTIHDAGLSAHGVYIAMERLHGRDLRHALAENWRPSVEQAVQLVRRVAEALAYAHAHGVVHCDIKPANIFLQRRDRPKVLDFGIARVAHSTALPVLDGAVAGSPRYRAPEQLAGEPVDPRTDLFSLGAVAYELLTGQKAFEGDTLAEINAAVMNQRPRPAHVVDRRVPEDLSAIVDKLLARAPADRYTCASELVMDLRRWTLRHQDLRPQRPHGARQRSRRGALPRWLLGGAVALAAAAAVAALMSQQLQHDEAAPAPARASIVAPSVPAAPAVVPAATPAPTGPATDAAGSATPAPATSSATPPPGPQAADSARPAPAAAAASPGPAAATRPRPATEPAAAARTRAGAAPAAVPAPSPAAGETAATAAPAAVAATGVVQIAVTPWGQVEVDGAAVGTTPPLTRLNLAEGTHTITVRNSDFPPYTTQVQVSADRTAVVRHRFGS